LLFHLPRVLIIESFMPFSAAVVAAAMLKHR